MKRILLLASLFAAAAAFGQGPSGFHLSKTYHIASNGGWDYISVEPASQHVFVSHGTQVNVLNKMTGDSVGYIPNTPGVHGIAFDKALNMGYTSNGRGNNVSAFDLKTFELKAQIATGENPDAIMFEPFSKTIITCNGRSKDLSVIDPVAGKVIATIPVGGKPETAVSDGAGNVFVNIEDKNEIVVVDIRNYSVTGHWSLAPGDGPTGLEIDTKTHRLFAGCDKNLMVMDATNGKIVAQLPIGDGCDGVGFDASLGYVFTSNGEGTVTVIKEVSANLFKVEETVPTKKGARTIAVDPATHMLFLPASDTEPVPAGSPARTRPRMIPGSFQILVVDRSKP